LQPYTYHSSTSLFQLLEPSRSHNYNDTSVHIIHIGFTTLDSCRNQYIKVAQSYPPPQQDQDLRCLNV
jgi:hypothetical protein